MKSVYDIKTFLTNLSEEHNTWQIAIREEGKEFLYEGNSEGFNLIPNSIRYWRADPFLFKYNNRIYLFAEMFDRIRKKGVIGVAEYRNGKCGKFRVCLKSKFHFSYPLVFSYEGEIYMLPECSESGQVSLYKCKEFPMKWVLDKHLFQFSVADATPVYKENEKICGYFATMFSPPEKDGANDNLYWLNNENGAQQIKLFGDNKRVRPAGKLIILNNKIIRPAQNDTIGYGESLLFYQVNNLNCDEYNEHLILEIFPPGSPGGVKSLSLTLNNADKDILYTGIHTYNCCENIEVVDVSREYVRNIFVFIKNLKLYLKEKFFSKGGMKNEN